MANSRRISMIILAVVIILFAVSWILKTMTLQAAGTDGLLSIRDAFFITFAALSGYQPPIGCLSVSGQPLSAILYQKFRRPFPTFSRFRQKSLKFIILCH